MASKRTRGTWVILVSIFLAGLLAIVPLPPWLEEWRPKWMTLVVIYWVIALPHRVGLFTAWCLGFFTDVLEGTLLGLNAFTLTLVAYGALSFYQRMRMFTPLQQSLTVLMLVGVQQLLVFWVLTATGQNTATDLSFITPALSSALLWPLVFILLRSWRRGFLVT
jgi:rod shape-determining protein MreD